VSPRPLLLTGGRVLDPSRGLDVEVGDVLIVDGKIEHAGDRVAGPDDAERLDCAGLVVSPGFVDVHCHLREPGREDVETIASGARAAAAGGFTAVCAMPNTDPVTDNQAAVGFIIRQAQRADAARVYPIGAITIGQKGETLAEFGEMVAAGAVAVSDDGRPVVSAQIMRTALEYARTFGIPVADHCEEPTLAKGGAMNEGVMSMRLGLKGIPAEAEEIMAIRDILLARRTGGHVHLCHMSTRGSVELIRWGKERGIRVTAEVCPHHLSLTEAEVEGYDTNAKMNPPLRTADDVAALQEAVRDGTIDCVATDHAPHHYDEKEREFADAPNGIVGLETALGVLGTWLVAPGILSYAQLVDRMACAPARIFGLPGGTLGAGNVGDLTVFDPTAEWVVDPARFRSRGRNSPYAGRTLRGRVHATVVGGRVVYRDVAAAGAAAG
jgi:dihydroorotase